MDNGLARVISTTIFTLGVLAVVFATGNADQNYATVKFDGGYSQIGIVYEERVSSEAYITLDDEIIIEGDIGDVIEWISSNSDESTTWKKGVTLSASTSIDWTASRQNFDLTTDSYDLVSDGTTVARDQINKLESMVSRAQSTREVTSNASLTFSKDPNSGVIGELISLLK